MRRPATLLAIPLALGAAAYAAPAGAHSPTRIENCARIAAPGSYVLARNLSAQGDCLVIEADFVTIDLNGFALTGNGTAMGIRAEPANPDAPLRGLAVRNGTVTNFENGVLLLTLGSIVEGVRAIGNINFGINVTPNGIVRGNTAVDNGVGIVGFGIVTGNVAVGNGIGIFGDGIVTGNTADGNDNIGISANEGSTVTGNTVVGSVAGIVANEGSTVTGNTVRDNERNGIAVSCPSNVIGNTATANGGANLTLVNPNLCGNVNNVAP